MITFRLWLSEYAGQTLGHPVNGAQFLLSGVKSQRGAEGQGTRGMSPDKADKNFLGKTDKKNQIKNK